MLDSHMQKGVFPPFWTQELMTLYLGAIARQFVLHFNITDLVVNLDNEKPAPDGKGDRIPWGNVVGEAVQFREYLHNFLRAELNCQSIYTYSLAQGLVIDEYLPEGQTRANQDRGAARQRASEAWKAVYQEQGQGLTGSQQQQVPEPTTTSDYLKILGSMLRQAHPISQRAGERPSNETAPIAVILDYAEKLIPYRLGDGQGDRDQQQALEMVQRWGLDTQFRFKTKNIVIILTTNIGQITANVYAGGSGCRAIRIHLPSTDERKAFIRWRLNRGQFPQIDAFGVDAERRLNTIARETQGMRLTDIDNLSRRVIQQCDDRGESWVMLPSDVQREKSVVIQAQSEDLLEILQPRRGFEEIGGLYKLKEYLGKRTEQMSSGEQTLLVPSGLLLAGPPGTGKTIIAEALARESNFNLVKMRNIQDRWVGSSERNLELVINLLKDLHPVVVFVDEIDQAMVKRDTGGGGGDSGVSARMFARILEEMSDARNRGRILWVAATNRVDLLDDALLRRFDRVVPLLAPDVDEACRIFATMPKTITSQSDGEVLVKYSGDLAQDAGVADDASSPNLRFHDAATEVVKRGLTGAGIEIIVRRAVEIACEDAVQQGKKLDNKNLPGIEARHLQAAIKDYIPNQDRSMYDYQSLLAIRGCNFRSVMPDLPDREPFNNIKNEGEIDPIKVDYVIQQIKASRRHNSR